MHDNYNSTLKSVFSEFDIDGEITRARPYGNGHINDTFLVEQSNGSNHKRYIFQHINHHVFRDPEALMANFCLITNHLVNKLRAEGVRDIERRALQAVRSRTGDSFVYDGEDNLWRATEYIDDTITYELVDSPKQAYEVGKIYGEYQRNLLDLPNGSLSETIRDFHNTRYRYDCLDKAIKEDPYNRAAGAAGEIDFIRQRGEWTDHLIELQLSGQMPTRIIHNDTKVNNLLIDAETSAGVCVTDLDTTMPGLVLSDFGDMVRTAANTAPEDESDLSKVGIDIERFRALAQGYLSSTRGFITAAEKENLVFSGKLITYELAIRFLTDYLEGDHYFKIDHERHNLQRCRSQLALVRALESLNDELESIVETIFNGQ